MKLFITSHNKTFTTEWLKLKRTGLLWMCLGAALFVPLIGTIASFFIDASDRGGPLTWQAFINQKFSGFASFFFPLYLAIMMVRLVYLEHRSDTWKLMETQPVPKAALFIAKYEVALLISLLSLLGLVFFSLLGGWLLQTVKGEEGLKESSIDWGLTFGLLLRYWIASFGLIAIQYFLSLFIKSFAWPMTIGLIMIIAGSIFMGFGVFNWFPYAATLFTSASETGSQTGAWLLHHEKLSILWALLFLFLGYQYFKKKDFVKAFFSPAKQLVPTIAALAVFALLFWIINKPTVLNRYGKMVLAGTLQTDKPVANVYVFHPVTRDTIARMLVKDGRFYFTSAAHLTAGTYLLEAGSIRTPVFLTAIDSTHLQLEIEKDKQEIKFGGTRLSENEFLTNYSNNNFYLLRNNAYKFKPEDYINLVIEEWSDGVKSINKFKTVDNLKPAADFIQQQKKLLAARLLYFVDVLYPQTFAIYYPNDNLKYPATVANLRNQLSLNDPSLLTATDYTKYLTDYLQYKAQSSTNSDSLFFKLAQDSLRGGIKDLVLYQKIGSKMSLQTDSARRQAWLQAYLPTIKNKGYQQKLTEQITQLENLQRGRKAHNFLAEALNGNDYTLANLANRYVVVDVWATWCGPCKRESPYFDQLAEQYTHTNVAFVSVSVDEDKNAWKMDAPSKSKRVLQLWAKNATEDFMKKYAVATIPRFMLIDARGNIINAAMPLPSSPEFEQVLHKEIPFLSSL